MITAQILRNTAYLTVEYRLAAALHDVATQLERGDCPVESRHREAHKNACVRYGLRSEAAMFHHARLQEQIHYNLGLRK